MTQTPTAKITSLGCREMKPSNSYQGREWGDLPGAEAQGHSFCLNLQECLTEKGLGKAKPSMEHGFEDKEPNRRWDVEAHTATPALGCGGKRMNSRLAGSGVRPQHKEKHQETKHRDRQVV